MAVNQVYKGDLVEVSMAKETGFFGQGDNASTGWATANGSTDNSSVITIGSNVYWYQEVPKNMLVGATLRIYSSGGSNALTADDFASTRRSYYITANTDTTITISPRLATTGAITANTGDYFIIDSARIPTMDAEMTYATPDDRIKADQFLGLLNSFALPEPEVDVRKQHIVGMGRDVNILTSGREMLQGGSFDTNAHSLRWLRYGLGGHTALGWGELSNVTAADTVLTELPLNINYGASASFQAQQYGSANTDAVTGVDSGTGAVGIGSNIDLNADALLGARSAGTGTGSTINLTSSTYAQTHENAGATGGVFKTLSSDGLSMLYGSYTSASTTTLSGCATISTADAVTRANQTNAVVYILAKLEADIAHGDIRVDVGSTIAGRFSVGEYIQIVDKDTIQIPGADDELPTINKHEIRRVIAIDGAYVYVEEPFCLTHTATSCGIDRIIFTYDSTQGATRRGSPAILATTNELRYGITHTFYGNSSVPTFAIEQSFRKSDATPGSEHLLRVFSGCKVNSVTCSADTEGEVKLNGEYEATRMFTDTESRFVTPHRLFENTANTNIKRRVSGIAVNGEKPYLFQHIIFSAFGAPVVRATQLEFSVNNTNTARYYIRGTDGTYASTDQVSEAAVNYATEITEAQREYTFKFNALVEDNRFFEQLRQRKHFLNTNDITIVLSKPGSASNRQKATITIEDYTVLKAEMPIPDDKGPVTANVELAVRHLKVEETNPYPIL